MATYNAHEMLEIGDLIDGLLDPLHEGQHSAGSSWAEEASSVGDSSQASSPQRLEGAQSNAAAASTSICWGAVLKGDGGASCELSGFASGKMHFKSKFCAACIESIEIPASRVRAMRPEMQGLFANSQRAGFWKTAPDSLGGGEVRIANNTITCDGPWLIVYRDLPPELPWEPMPDGWVDPATGMVRLSVGKGTLVPSCEMWRHAPGRKHAGSAGAGAAQGSSVHSWQVVSAPKRRRRAGQGTAGGSSAWPVTGGGSGGGGGVGGGVSLPSSMPVAMLAVPPTAAAPIAAAVPLQHLPSAVASPMVSELTPLDSTAAFSHALVAAQSEVVSLLEMALHPDAPLRQRLSQEHAATLLANLAASRGALSEAQRIEAEIYAQAGTAAPLPPLSQPAACSLQPPLSQPAPGLPRHMPQRLVPGLAQFSRGPSGEGTSLPLPHPASPTPSATGSVQSTSSAPVQRAPRPLYPSSELSLAELSLKPKRWSLSAPKGLGSHRESSRTLAQEAPAVPPRVMMRAGASDSRLLSGKSRVKTLRDSFKTMFGVFDMRNSSREQRSNKAELRRMETT